MLVPGSHTSSSSLARRSKATTRRKRRSCPAPPEWAASSEDAEMGKEVQGTQEKSRGCICRWEEASVWSGRAGPGGASFPPACSAPGRGGPVGLQADPAPRASSA